MKGRVERVSRVIIDKAKAFFAPEELHKSVYSSQAEVIFRRDGRSIIAIANDGGYVGREFCTKVRSLRAYVLQNRPLIGYGGCVSPELALKWGSNREPMDMHIHITDPGVNKVVVVNLAALLYQIGEVSSELGTPGKSLTINQVLGEEEYLTVNDVGMRQFIASIARHNIEQLNEGLLVPNELKTSGIDETAPEFLSIADIQNATSILSACIRSNRLEKAEEIATKLEADRVLKECTNNKYENKTRQELYCFWKSVNPSKAAELTENENSTNSIVIAKK